MKNKTLIYVIVIVVALIATLVFVQVFQKGRYEKNWALSLIPEKPVLLAMVHNIKEFTAETNKKLELLEVKDFNIYSKLLENTYLEDVNLVASPEDLESKLGISKNGPLGIAILDSSNAAGMLFYNISNKTIFLDQVKKSFDIKEEKTGDISYLKVTCKKDRSEHILYFYKSAALFFENSYYLKKILKDEGKKFKDNQAFCTYSSDKPEAIACVYVDTHKVGEYISNILAFFKPAINQQFQQSLSELKLQVDSSKITDAVLPVLDVIISFMKSQDYLLSSVTFDEDGLSIDTDLALKLSKKAAEAFSSELGPNPLLGKLPDGAFLVTEDNVPLKQTMWWKETKAKSFESLIRIMNIKKDESVAEDIEEREVFGMYKASVESATMPFSQIVLNYYNPKQDLFQTTVKKLDEVNTVFDAISFIIPFKMHFSSGDVREFRNVKIKKFHLDFLPNDKYIFKNLMQSQSGQQGGWTMHLPGRYLFEIAGINNIEVFTGNDPDSRLMNDLITDLMEPTGKKLVENPGFKAIQEKKTKNATVNVYINLTDYMSTILSMFENEIPNSKATIKALYKSFVPSWDMVSIKFEKSGIKSEVYINFHDVQQMIKVIKAIDQLASNIAKGMFKNR